jgi:hypothetical protein
MFLKQKFERYAMLFGVREQILCMIKQINLCSIPVLSQEMFNDLGELLCTITGFDSFSLQPNAGAAGEYAGEYAGLMVIRAYHKVR